MRAGRDKGEEDRCSQDVPGAGSLVAAAAMLLTGCGNSQEEDLRRAVEGYSTAFLSGDATRAHALLSTRCQARVSVDALRGITALAGRNYGQQPIASFTVDDLSGDLARVTYAYRDARINQTREPWVREAGVWKQDDC